MTHDTVVGFYIYSVTPIVALDRRFVTTVGSFGHVDDQVLAFPFLVFFLMFRCLTSRTLFLKMCVYISEKFKFA